MFICPKRMPVFSLSKGGCVWKHMGYWMASPCDWHGRPPVASGWSPAALALLIRRAVMVSSSQASLPGFLTPCLPGAAASPLVPLVCDASVPLLMGLLGLKCSCLHLAYLAEASPRLWASLNLPPFSSCVWRAVGFLANTHNILETFLLTHL